MIKPEQVPKEVWDAAEAAFLDAAHGNRQAAWTASIAAALNAWPGMETSKPDPWSFPDRLILPIPQEATNG